MKLMGQSETKSHSERNLQLMDSSTTIVYKTELKPTNTHNTCSEPLRAHKLNSAKSDTAKFECEKIVTNH